MMRVLRQFVIAALLASCAHAAELAILRNGFAIRHVSREVVGMNTRLHIDSGGYVDVPTAQIESFERDDAPPAVQSSSGAAQAFANPNPAKALTASSAVPVQANSQPF